MAGADRLRGFVAQSMSGRKVVRLNFVGMVDSLLGATSFTATVACYVFIFAHGGGGGGGAGSAGVGSGGNGADAGYKRFFLKPGQSISWTPGAAGATNASIGDGTPGGDTTVLLPNGVTLTAGGGKNGLQSGATPPPNVSSGPWDLLRSGGLGGATGASGASPAGGGVGGAPGGSSGGGGGGSAGFKDKFQGALAGNGGTGNLNVAAGSPGAGSGASTGATTSAGSGRVQVFAFSAAA
jgi:hypothetical protein